ncbi:Brp/Blh family beta-carotene 15,15'-dioxygenase [Croceivirga radicis]|nr:Brp/Blh family beta-carotene 15,15'-dioxygenase [Croceivirga radicis]
MKEIALILSFLSLWISTKMNGSQVQLFAFSLILTIGMLHGANDLSIIRKVSSSSNIIGYLMWYVFVIIAVSFLFVLFKPLTLFLFILVSGFHFGEQHLFKYVLKPSRLLRVLYLFYGNLILFIIFSINLNKVQQIVFDFSGYNLPVLLVYVPTMVLGILVLLFFILGYNRNLLEKGVAIELAYFIIITGILYLVSLPLGFAIYFVFWHSLPSLRDQIKHLYGKTDKQAYFGYIKSSWPYWLVSLLGIILLYWFFSFNHYDFLNVIFYMLLLITFPHVIVMHRLFNSIKTES